LTTKAVTEEELGMKKKSKKKTKSSRARKPSLSKRVEALEENLQSLQKSMMASSTTPEIKVADVEEKEAAE
jgi:hypothetical protein